MIALGIDPGLANLGWCVLVDGHFVAGGIFRTECTPKLEREAGGISKGEDKMRRADEIGAFLDSTISIFRPELIAHEGISLGFHQPMTLFDMGIAFGAIAAAAASHGAPRAEVKPAQIKAWACPGRKGVTKAEVIAAVRERAPGIPWPRATLKHEHLADAYAAATIAGEVWRGSALWGRTLPRPFPPAAALAPALAAHLPALPAKVKGAPRPEHDAVAVKIAVSTWHAGRRSPKTSAFGATVRRPLAAQPAPAPAPIGRGTVP